MAAVRTAPAHRTTQCEGSIMLLPMVVTHWAAPLSTGPAHTWPKLAAGKTLSSPEGIHNYVLGETV